MDGRNKTAEDQQKIRRLLIWPEDLYSRLGEEARRRTLSINALVRTACLEFLQAHEERQES